MKMNVKLSVIAAAVLASVSLSNAARAESTYGYNSTGSGAIASVTAKADLKITVQIPQLILLKVGTSGSTIDEVILGASISIPATPTTPTTTGNNQPVNWDGNAPTISFSTTSSAVSAAAWTNASGGGSLTASTTGFGTAISGLDSGDIQVASSGGSLTHPGTTTDFSSVTPTTFSKNTVTVATWTYSVNPAMVASLGTGSASQTITYTASNL